MMTRILAGAALLPALVLTATAVAPSTAQAAIRSTPDLGKAEGRCRAGESGPAFLVDVQGLKDRRGRLKLEIYPANSKDWLAPDNELIAAGKTFRRVEVDVPANGTPSLCVRLPGAGTYGVMLLHDRDSNRKFGWRTDGVGFAGNPKLGLDKPSVRRAVATVGNSPARLSIVLNYQRGFGMRPLAS